MKWIYLFAIIVAAPLLTVMLRSKPRYIVHLCFFLGVSIFALAPNLWTALIGWPGWPAPVKGIELSFVDSISVALILSTRPIKTPTAIKVALSVICAAIVVSSIAASQLIPVLFYVCQLFRSVLLFYAIGRSSITDRRAPMAVVYGLGAGVMYEALYVAYQFATGVQRAGGNLGHANFLGLTLDFVIPPAFALMLGTRRSGAPAAMVLAGLFVAVLGASRATLGLFAGGLLLTLVFSLKQKRTSRKLAFAGTTAILLLVSAPVLLWGIQQRSQAAIESSDYEREAMKSAATMIIADHPFGVGADQYVVNANLGGYSDRAGVAWNFGTRTAPVHDTYYLVTAELGFLGLIGLISLFISVGLVGLRLLRAPVSDEALNIAPGLLASVVLLAVHISYEFVFMDFIPHYLFAIVVGLLVGLRARLKGAERGMSLEPDGAPLLQTAPNLRPRFAFDRRAPESH